MHVAQLPGLARERRAQTAAPRGLEHGVAGWYARVCLRRSSRITSDSVRRSTRRRPPRRLGHDEALDEHAVSGDTPSVRQAGFDDVHVRARDRRRRSRRARDRPPTPRSRGVKEAALGVEMMMDRRAGRRCSALQPLELAGEDDRVGAPVRVDEQDRARRRRERALDDRDHRRDAAAARERDDRHVARRAARRGRSGASPRSSTPGDERVVHPVRHAAAGRRA